MGCLRLVSLNGLVTLMRFGVDGVTTCAAERCLAGPLYLTRSNALIGTEVDDTTTSTRDIWLLDVLYTKGTIFLASC